MRREKCADEGGRLGPTLPQHKAFIHVAPPHIPPSTGPETKNQIHSPVLKRNLNLWRWPVDQRMSWFLSVHLLFMWHFSSPPSINLLTFIDNPSLQAKCWAVEIKDG